MSDGERKDKFLNEKGSLESKKKKKLGTDDFAQAIARIAVAQVTERVGFQSFHQSALDNLADVGIRYIREIGKTASSHANLANRSECNVFDVIQGLEDLGSVQGFAGASDIRHCFSGSGIVKDIMSYVGQADEILFAYSIPLFPVVKERTMDPSLSLAEENPRDEHIPSWLPKFPDPVTYADLSSGDKKDSEKEVVNKIHQVEELHKKAERSLLNLQQKLKCNGSEAGVAVEHEDAAQVRRAAETNPFLAPPLQFWEKELSLPVVPARLLDESLGYNQSLGIMENHPLVMEPSLQANEAERSGPCEPEDRGKILLNGRPSVHFRFVNAKKSLSLVTSPQNEEIERISLWFGKDNDGEEEKKRRAEKKLLDYSECPLEASHL